MNKLPFNSEIFESNFSLNEKSISELEKDFFEGNIIVMRGIPARYMENLLIGSALKKSNIVLKSLIDNFVESVSLKYYLFSNQGVKCEFNYKGKTLKGMPEKYTSFISDTDWINAFMACLLNRDMQRLKQLSEYDIDIIGKPKQGVTGGEHTLLFAKFLQKLFTKGENHSSNLLKVAKAISKDTMPAQTYEHALLIYGPLIDMFTNIIFPDNVIFNNMLFTALENHLKYHQKDDLIYPYSTTSLWISAVCSMAKDYGLKIEHSSDFLIVSLI